MWVAARGWGVGALGLACSYHDTLRTSKIATGLGRARARQGLGMDYGLERAESGALATVWPA